MVIINERFAVGQVYEGAVNGARLEVVDIKEPRTYTGLFGIEKTLTETHVVFKDLDTGRKSEVNIKTAQRLLLRLVKKG